MEANSFSYAIKVWFTSIILWSLLIGIWTSIDAGVVVGLTFSLFLSLISLVFSLPSFWLFVLAVWAMQKMPVRYEVKMGILSLLIVTLTVFSFRYLVHNFEKGEPNHPDIHEVYVGMAYYLPAIMAIVWFYPKNMRVVGL